MTITLSSERIADDLHDTASLLGSRVCHDLISPMGAISNGLELLAMSGTASSPEFKLIEESIENANSKLKFFRVAFGASIGGQMMSRADVAKVLDATFSTGRTKIKWDAYSDPTRTEVKLAFLSILCLETALPQGGEIVVGSDRGEWQYHAYGPKIRYDADTWAHLKGTATARPASGQVQFLLMREALTTVIRSPQLGHSDSAVSLRY